MFSPIARGRREGREESDTEEEEMDSSSRDLRVSVTPAVREPDPPCPPCPIPEGEQGNLTADMTAGETSQLYQTADSIDSSRAMQEMDTDSNLRCICK